MRSQRVAARVAAGRRSEEEDEEDVAQCAQCNELYPTSSLEQTPQGDWSCQQCSVANLPIMRKPAQPKAPKATRSKAPRATPPKAQSRGVLGPRTVTSKFRGISKTRGGRWRCRIWHRQIGEIEVGHFDSQTEAARAYDAKAIQLYGPSASLNFPDDPPDDSELSLLAKLGTKSFNTGVGLKKAAMSAPPQPIQYSTDGQVRVSRKLAAFLQGCEGTPQEFSPHSTIAVAGEGGEANGSSAQFSCCICKGKAGGVLMCCDNCPGVYHLDCMPKGPSREVIRFQSDQELWYCHMCVARGLVNKAHGRDFKMAGDVVKRKRTIKKTTAASKRQSKAAGPARSRRRQSSVEYDSDEEAGAGPEDSKSQLRQNGRHMNGLCSGCEQGVPHYCPHQGQQPHPSPLHTGDCVPPVSFGSHPSASANGWEHYGHPQFGGAYIAGRFGQYNPISPSSSSEHTPTGYRPGPGQRQHHQQYTPHQLPPRAQSSSDLRRGGASTRANGNKTSRASSDQEHDQEQDQADTTKHRLWNLKHVKLMSDGTKALLCFYCKEQPDGACMTNLPACQVCPEAAWSNIHLFCWSCLEKKCHIQKHHLTKGNLQWKCPCCSASGSERSGRARRSVPSRRHAM